MKSNCNMEEKENFDGKDFEYFKPTEPLKNNYEKSHPTSAFTVMGWVFFILAIISLIVMIFLHVNMVTIFSNALVTIISLSCIFGLGNARERITLLENKKSQDKKLKELESDIDYWKKKTKELEKKIDELHKKS